MTGNNIFILTGPPGSGKTTLIQYLRSLGYATNPEPARKILAEQRRIGGEGLPGVNDRVFVELMLSKMMEDYERAAQSDSPVIFDRGIPDSIGYARHFELDFPAGIIAAKRYPCNNTVFFAPAWDDIYTTDEERKMTFAATCKFSEHLRDVYVELGYTLVDLPCASIDKRAHFILESMQTSK